jgi:pilus assembly protein Flp/PilA
MKTALIRFTRQEKGATSIEYGIIAGLMAVVLISIFGSSGTLQTALIDTFGRIVTALGTT